jgi:hypothetical protein
VRTNDAAKVITESTGVNAHTPLWPQTQAAVYDGVVSEGLRRANGTSPAPARPAAFTFGAGHLVMHGNAAFRAAFGERSVGLPAREVLLDLPGEAFDLLDKVFTMGRPLARWINRGQEEWRLTAAPRVDPESNEVYGVLLHLRARTDLPVVVRSADRG